MRETRELEIGGKTYRVTQLPAMRSLKLLNRLGRVLGPALGTLAGAATSSSGLSGMDVGKLGEAAELLFDKLSEKELEDIVLQLTELVECSDGEKSFVLTKPHIDTLFQGDVGGLLKLVAFALEVNYGSFLGELVGKLRPAPKATPSN